MQQRNNIDPREFRRVLGSYVTGVTVMTSLGDNQTPVGLTVNSFSSVSLDPPLILWSQSLTAPSYPAFRDAERFAVSILAEDQCAISDRFSRAGAEKFRGVRLREGLGGVPLIEGASAYLECVRVATYPGGDHAIFLGQVVHFEQCDRSPLVFGGGRYLSTAAFEQAAPLAA